MNPWVFSHVKVNALGPISLYTQQHCTFDDTYKYSNYICINGNMRGAIWVLEIDTALPSDIVNN